jgi:23S rRNA U2552 (ribose-2'-O)-methylase RlmE/FtsJ
VTSALAIAVDAARTSQQDVAKTAAEIAAVRRPLQAAAAVKIKLKLTNTQQQQQQQQQNARMPFEVVVNDMAPSTCGNKEMDSFKSAQLSVRGLQLALYLHQRGGAAPVGCTDSSIGVTTSGSRSLPSPLSYLTKVLEGRHTALVRKALTAVFGKGNTKVVKPDSSRPDSSETFFVASSAMASKSKRGGSSTHRQLGGIPEDVLEELELCQDEDGL